MTRAGMIVFFNLHDTLFVGWGVPVGFEFFVPLGLVLCLLVRYCGLSACGWWCELEVSSVVIKVGYIDGAETILLLGMYMCPV